MSDKPTNPENADYEVGYGKPPRRTRFRKGRSGNPGGRPRGVTAGRAKALALKEAYRMVGVKVGDEVVYLPAIQAILRGQIALAAKGNASAQRELAAEAAAEAAEAKHAGERPMPDRELARRIAWILSGAGRERSSGGDGASPERNNRPSDDES
jgi:hypothetical protein